MVMVCEVKSHLRFNPGLNAISVNSVSIALFNKLLFEKGDLYVV